MTNEEYLEALMLALRARMVQGADVGRILSETSNHLEDSGSDPEDEFGDPVAFAEQFTGIWRFPRSVQLRIVTYLISTGVGMAAANRMWVVSQAGLAPVTLAHAGAFIVGMVGYVAFSFWLLTKAAEGLDGRSFRSRDRVVFAVAWTTSVGFPVATYIWLPDRVLLTWPTGVWVAVFAASVVHVGYEIRRQRREGYVPVSRSVPADVRKVIGRYRGVEALKRSRELLDRSRDPNDSTKTK